MRLLRFAVVALAPLLPLAAFVAAPREPLAAPTVALGTVAATPGDDPCAALPRSTPLSGMTSAGATATPGAGASVARLDPQDHFDLAFIDLMIPQQAASVAMARVALTRAEHPETRALAEEIIRRESDEIAQLRQWRGVWFPGAMEQPMDQMLSLMDQLIHVQPATPEALPPALDMTMDTARTLARLCTTTASFDLVFLDTLIAQQQRTIMMAQLARQRAGHPELKALAQAIAAAEGREMAQMEDQRAAWYGATPPAAWPTPDLARR